MNAKPRILVVDDQPNNVTLLSDLLSLHGYDVVSALSGLDALRETEQGGVDLVLLDIVMPGMSGYEVCRRLREQPLTQVLPVIMITALDPGQERVKGLEAGADDFLAKPINSSELLARVKSLLRVKTLYDQVQEQAARLAELNTTLERRVEQQVNQLARLSQLQRFFPAPLVDLILAGDVEDPLRTRRKEVTVVFVDLRGFTHFSDTSEPEEVMGLLRDYHGTMGRIIDDRGGTLEQFAGDGLMVIFNDPVSVENPAACAVRMAVDMQVRFRDLTVNWAKRGHDIGLGIGIAHGYATIGAIGYEARIGYGIIGRVSNLAARLCAEAKHGQILISQSAYALVEGMVQVRPEGPLNLRGFAHPVAAYSVRTNKAK